MLSRSCPHFCQYQYTPMNSRLPLLSLLAATAILSSAFAESPLPAPLFEERFNGDNPTYDLQNGAQMGAAGSGVSGQTRDLCYTADGSSFDYTAKAAGPVALLDNSAVVEGQQEMTITLWYKCRQESEPVHTLIKAFGFDIFMDEKTNSPIVWITAPADPAVQDHQKWFRADASKAVWNPAGGWVFAAITWSNAEKTVRFFQGGTDTNVALINESLNEAANFTQGLSEGTHDIKRTVGNNGVNFWSPFDGSIDNVRFFPGVLSEGELERIRLADLKNQQAQ